MKRNVWCSALCTATLVASVGTATGQSADREAARATPVVDHEGKYPRGPIVSGAASQPAQVVFIDPKTGRTIPRPPDADPSLYAKTRADVDYTIRATPEGYLYIDTTNLKATSRATLGSDGKVELACTLDHDHAEDSP